MINIRFGCVVRLIVFSVVNIAFSSCLVFTSGLNSSRANPLIEVERIATNLDRPVAITHANDGSGRLFITVQGGHIFIYDGKEVLTSPFLDISALVSCCGERGLLSVAFHPRYKQNGEFFVNYTDLSGDTVVARYEVSEDPNVADSTSASILLTVPQPYPNHNGGQLQFGADGYLYVGMGDGGRDSRYNAQALSSLLGKILRIDVDGGAPYAIPPDNPFVHDPSVRGEIWALGLRNPWRFSFDRMMGDVFIGDVGQGSWEEVNFQSSDSGGGENYGWPSMEGNHCFEPPTDCDDGSLTLPIIEYGHSIGCSVTGGYRYRGTRIPYLYGAYIYVDFCSGAIWSATKDENGRWTTVELIDTDFRISTFGEDEHGEIYLADLASGNIYRVAARAASVIPLLFLLLLGD